jgi:hypothetical protein
MALRSRHQKIRPVPPAARAAREPHHAFKRLAGARDARRRPERNKSIVSSEQDASDVFTSLYIEYSECDALTLPVP